MNPIVEENLISFKELEKNIFDFACELAREITRTMLESYDKELAEGRDKKTYRGKGNRKTSIKTVYGEVEYSRRVYQTKTKDGQTAHVFLLHQAMQMCFLSTTFSQKKRLNSLFSYREIPCFQRVLIRHSGASGRVPSGSSFLQRSAGARGEQDGLSLPRPSDHP